MLSKRTKFILNVIAIVVLFLLLWWAHVKMDPFSKRILNLMAIYIIWAVSLNFINGTTGIFSLGHNGFAAVGAYVAALLTLPLYQKGMIFYIEPLIYPLNSIQIGFFPATLLGGAVAAVFGILVGAPVLRLKGDYLAIATLGFSQIIFVLAMNFPSITNGALGLKGLQPYTNLFWSWGWAVFTVVFIGRLTASSYGRALKAIREDEVAAEAMGIRLSTNKIMAFVIGAFFAGIGGSLYAHLLTSIDPKAFSFFLTFNILIMIVIGGLGSITGSIIGAVSFAFLSEWLRFVEAPMQIGPLKIPGIPGMRMVIFSVLMLVVMLFYRRGIMGRNEFSWDWFYILYNRLKGKKENIPMKRVVEKQEILKPKEVKSEDE